MVGYQRLHTKRGFRVIKTWSGGKMEVTACNRSVIDGGGRMGQKGLEVEGECVFLSFKPKPFFIELDSSEEANWVMENGSRIFRGEAMNLE